MKSKKLFPNPTVFGIGATFFVILFGIAMTGGSIANQNSTAINSFLNLETFERVDDSSNTTPDVMYYKSDYMRYRWKKNESGKLEFQQEWNVDGLHNYCKSAIKQVNNEGTVLLWNKDNTLPLKENSNVSLFGTSVVSDNYITSGEGSGAHEANTRDTLRLCLESNKVNVNDTLTDEIELKASSGHKSAMHNLGGSDYNVVYFDINGLPFNEIQATADSTITQYGDTAIYVISRNGSENGDLFYNAPECVDGNYQDLSFEEINYLTKLKEYKDQGKLKKIVLVLNTCNAMQFKNIAKYDIDACIYSGNGGTSSFRSLADVLTGKADPNGHLADTYLNDNYSSPATVNQGDFTFTEMGQGLPSTSTYTHNTKYIAYQEGIYVGYRYYETRYEDCILGKGGASDTVGSKCSTSGWNYASEVAFPFGFGSSYATFERSNFKVEYDKLSKSYNCSLTIKNTSSDNSGKDVFQVYLQKPYTNYDVTNSIEKSAVELVGFAKTKSLNPNESQTLTVNVPLESFKTYDSYKNKSYILEKGNYYLSFGTDSHNAINNILAKKDVDLSLLSGEKNPDFAYLIDDIDDDFTTYKTSTATGKEITNQFDDADLNLYKGTEDQKINYLTRNRWKETYPTQAVSLKCTNQQMIDDMSITKLSNQITASTKTAMPVYNESNNLSVIDLMYEDFDSPLWDKLLNQMSQDEQIAIVTDAFEGIKGAESISMPSSKVQDGPAGIRKAANSMAYSGQTLMANTFNVPLVQKIGRAFGMECMQLGFTGIYGPGANIHRSAYSGRNFEYFSEDPCLSGVMLDAELDGICEKGVIPFTKHFALNDQERNRYGVTTWANEQTIREIYLKSFELSTTKGTTKGLMSSYNRLGTTWTGAHSGLLTGVLRNEWGFNGACETDCSAGEHMSTNEAVANAIVAGQDLWLGSPVKGKSFDYKNIPEVAQALRLASKRAIYAVVHSNSMNGIKSGVKFIAVKTWWEKTILGVQISSAVLSVICLALTTVGLIRYHKNGGIRNED